MCILFLYMFLVLDIICSVEEVICDRLKNQSRIFRRYCISIFGPLSPNIYFVMISICHLQSVCRAQTSRPILIKFWPYLKTVLSFYYFFNNLKFKGD